MWILILVGVLVLAVAVAAVLHFRFGLFRRRKAGGKSKLLEQSRVEVLESTPVDGERRLVLIRCDRIEHLILVGGPGDLVVENDVKKLRGPGAPAPKPADADALLETAGLGIPVQQPGRHAAPDRRAVAAPRSEPPPAPRPASRAPATNGGGARVEAASERPQRPAEAQPARRDPRPDPRPQAPRAIQPAPLGTARVQPRREPPPAQRGNGRRGDAATGLPAAGVPWSEPDSLENEIVRALRFDPAPRGGDKNGAQPATSANDPKPASDSSATLGDLADRLEEALAQEVQSVGDGRLFPGDADEFAFDIPPSKENAPSRPASPTVQNRAPERAESKPAEEKRSRPPRKEPQRMPAPQAAEPATAAETERKREQPAAPDRREEAPVISLNARRREAADPLEDEMARLLGELTGDTKGR